MCQQGLIDGGFDRVSIPQALLTGLEPVNDTGNTVLPRVNQPHTILDVIEVTRLSGNSHKQHEHAS